MPRHRRSPAAGQPSRLPPPRTLPHVTRQSAQQPSHLHSPPSPPSPAPAASPAAEATAAASSIARPKHHLGQSSRGQHQQHFGIKSTYVQHYNRSPPSSLQHQHHPPPPPPPPPPPSLRHQPSMDNPSLSSQRRMDYPKALSPPSGNGDGGRSRSNGGLMERGGGDNTGAGTNEGSALAFARRLPSPRYRQDQQQQLPRRPLSHQEQQWQQRQRARPPLPNGGKSLSVENILDEGDSPEGDLLSPTDPSLSGHLHYQSNYAHQSRGMRNEDSISLQQVSKRSMSNGVLEGRGRSSSPQKQVSTVEEVDGDRDYRIRPTSSGNQRRSSSGLRMMWQGGAQQHQSQQRSGPRFPGQNGVQSSSAIRPRLGRASSVESAASKLNEKSRSPSPGEGNLAPQKSHVGGGGVQSRLRKPLSTSSLPSAHHRAQQQGIYQQSQQRNSFGGGGGGGDHLNRVHQRAKSASNSQGTGRTRSPPATATGGASLQLQHQPQQQESRSAHLGQPPPPPRQGYAQQVPQRQQQVRSGFGYQQQQQHQHRSQPHLPSSSPSSPHHVAGINGRQVNGGGVGGGGGRNLYSSYQQHQTSPYRERSSQMQHPNTVATSHLRVPSGSRTNASVPAAGRHSSVGLPMPGFASSGSRSGQRTM